MVGAGSVLGLIVLCMWSCNWCHVWLFIWITASILYQYLLLFFRLSFYFKCKSRCQLNQYWHTFIPDVHVISKCVLFFTRKILQEYYVVLADMVECTCSMDWDIFNILLVYMFSIEVFLILHIKTKYIPSYIFENEGKIFKKLEKVAVFLRSGNCLS